MLFRSKKSSSPLSGGYAINYDRKKKRYRREIFITTRKKKVPVVCLAGLFWRLRPEKKKFQSSVWRVVLLWFWRLRPEKKKFQSSVWRVVSFWFWRLRPEKKKFQSSVWRIVLLRQFLVLAITTRKKKSSSCLSGRVVLRPEKKKVPVVCLAKKKRYSRLSVGCAVLAITTGKKRYSRLSGGLCCCIVSVFGSGGKLVVFLLWREIFITTGKKKFQSSVWRVCQFLVLAGNWQFFCCGGKFSLRPEKKKFQFSTGK